MALISCPECNKEISDQAIACPSCGFPVKAHFMQIEREKREAEEEVERQKQEEQLKVKEKEYGLEVVFDLSGNEAVFDLNKRICARIGISFDNFSDYMHRDFVRQFNDFNIPSLGDINAQELSRLADGMIGYIKKKYTEKSVSAYQKILHIRSGNDKRVQEFESWINGVNLDEMRALFLRCYKEWHSDKKLREANAYMEYADVVDKNRAIKLVDTYRSDSIAGVTGNYIRGEIANNLVEVLSRGNRESKIQGARNNMAEMMNLSDMIFDAQVYGLADAQVDSLRDLYVRSITKYLIDEGELFSMYRYTSKDIDFEGYEEKLKSTTLSKDEKIKLYIKTLNISPASPETTALALEHILFSPKNIEEILRLIDFFDIRQGVYTALGKKDSTAKAYLVKPADIKTICEEIVGEKSGYGEIEFDSIEDLESYISEVETYAAVLEWIQDSNYMWFDYKESKENVERIRSMTPPSSKALNAQFEKAMRYADLIERAVEDHVFLDLIIPIVEAMPHSSKTITRFNLGEVESISEEVTIEIKEQIQTNANELVIGRIKWGDGALLVTTQEFIIIHEGSKPYRFSLKDIEYMYMSDKNKELRIKINEEERIVIDYSEYGEDEFKIVDKIACTISEIMSGNEKCIENRIRREIQKSNLRLEAFESQISDAVKIRALVRKYEDKVMESKVYANMLVGKWTFNVNPTTKKEKELFEIIQNKGIVMEYILYQGEKQMVTDQAFYLLERDEKEIIEIRRLPFETYDAFPVVDWRLLVGEHGGKHEEIRYEARIIADGCKVVTTIKSVEHKKRLERLGDGFYYCKNCNDFFPRKGGMKCPGCRKLKWGVGSSEEVNSEEELRRLGNISYVVKDEIEDQFKKDSYFEIIKKELQSILPDDGKESVQEIVNISEKKYEFPNYEQEDPNNVIKKRKKLSEIIKKSIDEKEEESPISGSVQEGDFNNPGTIDRIQDEQDKTKKGEINETVSEFMFCTSCGGRIPRTAKFCTMCGTMVTYTRKTEA